MDIYYIGGSPCSGKSTIAELIAKKYNLHYFKVDDFLDKYAGLGAEMGYEICTKESKMSVEEIWMRDVNEQCAEELQIYCEIFEFIQSDLSAIAAEKTVIAEGAAFLPKLISKSGIPASRYLCITPTKEFQTEYYKRREWVPSVLEGCSDKEKAFENWMDRDALFAEDVRRQCEALGYYSIVTDGQTSISDNMDRVCRYFEL